MEPEEFNSTALSRHGSNDSSLGRLSGAQLTTSSRKPGAQAQHTEAFGKHGEARSSAVPRPCLWIHRPSSRLHAVCCFYAQVLYAGVEGWYGGYITWSRKRHGVGKQEGRPLYPGLFTPSSRERMPPSRDEREGYGTPKKAGPVAGRISLEGKS